MPNMLVARRGMVIAPHPLAAQAAVAVLREGGNAIEAALAAAVASTVLCPCSSGLGGDGFWIIAEPGKPPLSIDGSGASGGGVSPSFYHSRKLKAIPTSGPLSALTVAGVVSGWQLALGVSSHWGGRLPLGHLFADALYHARTEEVPSEMGGTLERLVHAGLDDFYRGEIGQVIAADLKAAGSPLEAEDLARHRGMRRRPLALEMSTGTVFSTAPPTLGLVSLMTLGVLERLDLVSKDDASRLHHQIRAAQRAVGLGGLHVADPHSMSIHAMTYLSETMLDHLKDATLHGESTPLLSGEAENNRETAWISVIDGEGRTAATLQSLHHPFGSGVVLPQTGMTWHNHGALFSLNPSERNCLEPRRRPRHPLAPLLAQMKDGRTLVWDDAQCQIFTRAVLLGQTWTEAVQGSIFAFAANGDIALSSCVSKETLAKLETLGHVIQHTPNEAQPGGGLVLHPDGKIEAAAGRGSIAGW